MQGPQVPSLERRLRAHHTSLICLVCLICMATFGNIVLIHGETPILMPTQTVNRT